MAATELLLPALIRRRLSPKPSPRLQARLVESALIRQVGKLRATTNTLRWAAVGHEPLMRLGEKELSIAARAWIKALATVPDLGEPQKAG